MTRADPDRLAASLSSKRGFRGFQGFPTTYAGKLSDASLRTHTCPHDACDSYVEGWLGNPQNPPNPLPRHRQAARARAPPRTQALIRPLPPP